MFKRFLIIFWQILASKTNPVFKQVYILPIIILTRVPVSIRRRPVRLHRRDRRTDKNLLTHYIYLIVTSILYGIRSLFCMSQMFALFEGGIVNTMNSVKSVCSTSHLCATVVHVKFKTCKILQKSMFNKLVFCLSVCLKYKKKWIEKWLSSTKTLAVLWTFYF